ncbi:HoxN/HupN/NixA family nickel/cobalt transporter [Paraburkholderia dinghuensis]|uniref:Nickel/cobalt efflux system n=1 Tax=Paraburkholderia dinghuensis TaxID=2305225 RepID=A0A3N6NDK1_9BURK|nr:HoxN/HupN/NixA family nickel/cobalt transporter [Paraburkholderia dinghuensis]RQH07072.1 HoxN/HupN/NixA family nickel/cobalt transporter [Paraburkholderia dinghuensis]
MSCPPRDLVSQTFPTYRPIVVLFGLLIAFNVGAWAWAFMAFRDYPLLMGSSLLAYSLGLRHAVDADHIAAIDNVTRKLMQTGQRPIGVGLMFSLGHSTVVVLASLAIVATTLELRRRFGDFREIGSMIGTLVSTFFLFAIALVNLVTLKSLVGAFRRVRRGERYEDEDLNQLLANRGLLARLFRPLFRLITRPSHMYFLGFLFGLGFDTASEVALLGIAAAGATQGLPIWSILVFPVLFTAGMTLIDTIDSVLMTGAYGWAFIKPVRKLYYNITITTVSVLVAVLVGAIEGLGLIAGRMHLEGRFWTFIGGLNDNFALVGYTIIGVLVMSWVLSAAVYRWKRLDEEPGAAPGGSAGCQAE